jgi:hypothetical protein
MRQAHAPSGDPIAVPALTRAQLRAVLRGKTSL